MGLFKPSKRALRKKLSAAIDRKDVEAVRQALNAGAPFGDTPATWPTLTYTARKNFTEAVEMLLAAGADPRELGPHERRAIDVAISNNNPEMLRLLLKHEAVFEGVDTKSITYEAALRGEEMLRMLVAAGARIPVGVIHQHASEGNAGAIESLLAVDASIINQPGDKGMTPLHVAAKAGNADIVRLLLQKGADVTCLDRGMKTAADYAESSILRSLLQKKIDAAMGNKNGAEEKKEETEGWVLTGPHEAVCISIKASIGYRLTEIFNSQRGIYTQISTNVTSGVESQSTQHFDTFGAGHPTIEEAVAACRRLGGQPDTAAYVAGGARIDKPQMRMPGG